MADGSVTVGLVVASNNQEAYLGSSNLWSDVGSGMGRDDAVVLGEPLVGFGDDIEMIAGVDFLI